MVPPWVPDIVDPVAPDGSSPAPPDDPRVDGTQSNPPGTPPPAPIASPGRFAGARRNFGSFANDGDKAAMRRGTGQYFKSGYGGGTTAVRRLSGTARAAAGLFGALSPGAAPGTAPPLDRAVLVGRSADQVMDAIIEAVRPIDGTLDAESSRAAIKDALSELLDQFPEADLLNLDDTQRTFAVERFVAIDVFRRIQLDIGKVIQDKAPTASAAMSRLKEVRDYVKETIASSFRKLEAAGTWLAAGIVQRIVRSALSEALTVFQAYAE